MLVILTREDARQYYIKSENKKSPIHLKHTKLLSNNFQSAISTKKKFFVCFGTFAQQQKSVGPFFPNIF